LKKNETNLPAGRQEILGDRPISESGDISRQGRERVSGGQAIQQQQHPPTASAFLHYLAIYLGRPPLARSFS